MTTALLLFLGTGVVIVFAGMVLARAADQIAERTGIGRVWVGSVILAAATSLPELGVDISAVRQGAVDLAAGDILGSSMANMLILAFMGLVPPRDEIFLRSSPDHMLAGALGIVLTAIVAVLIFTQASTMVAGIHPASLLLLVVFLSGSWVIYRQSVREHLAPSTIDSVAGEVPGLADEGSVVRTWHGPAVRFSAAALVLLAVAPTFSSSATTIAEGSGMGTTFFGTLFVGASTSLPEIVASVAAIRIGARDLAVGNLFGSNLFNATIFLAMDITHRGASIFAALNPAHVVSAMFAMMLMALGIASIGFRAARRYAMVEPGSILMIVAYVAGVAALYQMRAVF